mmetsp:Transcript_6639/g.15805  ORF Transcript_6639/g.15805 Transcript_6639/m.15805 type:complete len:110 (+) Transcript_6639:651-980(+)
MAWSNPSNTLVDGWWIVATMMRFCCLARSVMKRMMAAAAAASSPDVGSSRKRSFGCLISARAIERRRFWPPERPCTNSLPIRVSAQPARPMCVRMDATFSVASSAVPLR